MKLRLTMKKLANQVERFATSCSQAFILTVGLTAFGAKNGVKNSATVSPISTIASGRMPAIVPQLLGHY